MIPDEGGWSHFDYWDESVDDPDPRLSLQQQPAQEDHFGFMVETAAASPRGMSKVSSCYFSIASSSEQEEAISETTSVADLLSFLETSSQQVQFIVEEQVQQQQGFHDYEDDNKDDCFVRDDVLMNVFTFLDLESLSSFSETSRSHNHQVYFYLQMQLQHTLLLQRAKDETHSTAVSSPTLPGLGGLARLAKLDSNKAHEIVQEFASSSHSQISSSRMLSKQQQEQRLEAAVATTALLFTLLGAAAAASHRTDMNMMVEIVSEHSTQLWRLFLCGGSLMGAAGMSSSQMLQSDTQKRIQQVLRRMHAACQAAAHHDDDKHAGAPGMSSFQAMARRLQAAMAAAAAATEDATEAASYVPVTGVVSSDDFDWLKNSSDSTTTVTVTPVTGCVGTFSRAMSLVRSTLCQIVKDKRKAAFEQLDAQERALLGTALIDACASDASLDIVQELAQKMDLECFHVGSDGTETCALHAAAFHGSFQILEFLCRGILEKADFDGGESDGGLVPINATDANGWTALHFAAGANSVRAVQILADHGANLNTEAANGYTPMQWALRLQNAEVASELKRRMVMDQEERKRRRNNYTYNKKWKAASQPFSAMASRFLAMMPNRPTR